MSEISFAARTGTRRALFASALGALGLLAVVGGCGGGGTDAGTPLTTASAFTQGTITGFGSIIVNGVRFDETGARISDDDGASHGTDELKLGMQVSVDSTPVDASTVSAKALEVTFGRLLVGPVESVNVPASTLVVLGQNVDLTTSTVFDSSLSGGLAVVTLGSALEVHGLRDAASGHIVASRIELAPGATVFKLRGTVASFDATGKTFMIGAAVISYAGLNPSAVPAALANGAVVRATLDTTPNASGAWNARSVSAGGSHRPDEHAQSDIRGTISAFTSATQFSIDGLPVDASTASFPDGSTSLALGVQVEVKGVVSNGVLVATKVEVESRHHDEDSRRFELHGMITAVNTVAQTLQVRNTTVSFAGNVSYVGGSAADLTLNRRIEVKGVLAADGTTVRALKIKFES